METTTAIKAEAYQAVLRARAEHDKALAALDASSEAMIVARRNGTADDIVDAHNRITSTYFLAKRKLGRVWATYTQIA